MSNAQGTHRAARGAAGGAGAGAGTGTRADGGGGSADAGGSAGPGSARLPQQSDWDAVPNSSWDAVPNSSWDVATHSETVPNSSWHAAPNADTVPNSPWDERVNADTVPHSPWDDELSEDTVPQSPWEDRANTDTVPRSPWDDDVAPTVPLIPEQESAPAPAPVGARTAARRAAKSGRSGRSGGSGKSVRSGGDAKDGRDGGIPDPLSRALKAGIRPDALRKLLPRALVVAFLAGGTVAFLAGDKDVRLTVDGRPRTLHTFADDVEEVLARQGVTLGEHDLVTPAPQAELHDGDQVEVRYGRPVTLTLDGHRRQVWTTADTVEEALRELGVRAEGAHLSTSRGSTIGRHGLDLDVRTERTVTLLVDGRERTVRTNAATVREVVARSGIVLRNQDTTSVDPESFPREGQTISVLRISGTEEVREEPVRFRTEKHQDAGLFQGTEDVVTTGRAGVRRVTYAFRTVNGVKQKAKIVRSELVRAPVTQVVRVGTKPLPTSVAGADGLNWQGLAHCEAGGRPHAVDPSGTYGGLYQFDTRTWHSLGGHGRPQDAPAGEQTYRAKRLYIQRGSSPWPVCGRKLGG